MERLDQIMSEIQAEWQMSGLSSGIYGDFTREVVKRLGVVDANMIFEWLEAHDAEIKRQGEQFTDRYRVEYTKDNGQLRHGFGVTIRDAILDAMEDNASESMTIERMEATIDQINAFFPEDDRL